ncbi:winged helix-turn-helix domain-containing protein [Arsenicicoccus sp. oral taxon 190]|uniref:winged helix-turn-helix domain-containing protein n=1 Tax=Arsenicicoccus sp. oral taxon 190 TaxID=1658671 RepID=UPI000679EA73|nr:helix-turn-helix domain-containing protein [Arsenicicoccus sp. oral taxon 190]AKT51312.1 ArsR family transcriptional regulator [Arsenicicoccus sp. oral taxon 190]
MTTPAAPPPLSSVRLTAEAIKVLAHPLRSRLVGALRREGPSTATALAKTMGTNSGATSYHLRKLAEVGLVTEVGDRQGRRRLWAASADLTRYDVSDFADDEDADTALGWLERDWLQHFHEKFGAWLDARHRWPGSWQDAAGMSDRMIVVTDVQLRELQQRVSALVDSYATVGQGNPEAKRVAYYHVAYPLDLDKAPRRR